MGGKRILECMDTQSEDLKNATQEGKTEREGEKKYKVRPQKEKKRKKGN